MPVLLSRSSLTAPLAALSVLMIAGLMYQSLAFGHGATFTLQSTRAVDSVVYSQFVESWTQKVHDDAGGRISFRKLSMTEPQSGRDLFAGIQESKYDVIWIDLPDASEGLPRFAVSALPLSSTSSEGASKAVWDHVEMNDLNFSEFKEMRVIAASRHGAPLIHMRDKTIASLAELNGARIAVTNEDAENFVAALGAAPVRTQLNELRQTLSASKADGVLLSWDGVSAAGIADQLKIHVAAPEGAVWAFGELSVLLMHPGAYRSLTDDLRQVVRANSGSEMSALMGKILDQSSQATRQQAADRGDKLLNFPASDADQWQKAADNAINQRIDALDKRNIRGKKLVAGMRERLQKHDSK